MTKEFHPEFYRALTRGSGYVMLRHAMSCPVISCRVAFHACLVAPSLVMSCHITRRYVVSSRVSHVWPCHVMSCHVMSSTDMSCPVRLCDVMSCLDTPVVSCLETGPLMSFPWCHISRSASCRLFLSYGACHVCSSSLVLYTHRPQFLSCYVLPPLRVSCHVASCNM